MQISVTSQSRFHFHFLFVHQLVSACYCNLSWWPHEKSPRSLTYLIQNSLKSFSFKWLGKPHFSFDKIAFVLLLSPANHETIEITQIRKLQLTRNVSLTVSLSMSKVISASKEYKGQSSILRKYSWKLEFWWLQWHRICGPDFLAQIDYLRLVLFPCESFSEHCNGSLVDHSVQGSV